MSSPEQDQPLQDRHQEQDTHDPRAQPRIRDTHNPRAQPRIQDTHNRQVQPQNPDTQNPPSPDPDTHITSLIIQHRESASTSLSALVAEHPDLELALPGPTRSIVICESADRHAVMQRIDQLQALPGVLNVLLVYHHAEPAEALAESLSSSSITSANGAPP